MCSSASVSLIATVKNERAHLDRWLDSIARQSRRPDEIVIVDGGSTDGTWEALSAWRTETNVILLRAPGASISAGRNIGMARASGEVFAITDCGTVADEDWLERLVSPLSDPGIDVVSGFFVPERGTTWDSALAASTLPDVDDINASNFLPSSRSVAVRSGWVRRGFEFPEWLDYCEDLVWDMQLRDAGARFAFEPEAKVRFIGRPSAADFWRQYYRYARGDGKAGLFGGRHMIRYITYVGAAAVIVRRDKREAAVALVLAAAYVQGPIRRLLRRKRRDSQGWVSTVATASLIPPLRLIGDTAKMVGYPVGIAWRWRKYGTVNPIKNWRRITPGGDLWNPGSFDARTQPREG